MFLIMCLCLADHLPVNPRHPKGIALATAVALSSPNPVLLSDSAAVPRLDLSAQRFEGLGATGAEAVLASLRNNTTLEELSLSSNSLGAGAAAGLCAALRTAGGGSVLKRLGVGHNGLDAAAAKALQEVAMERGLVITV